MFSASSLLILACACAVAVNAQGYNNCITAQINDLSNYPVTLQTVILPPYQTDVLVHIPDVPECIYGEAGVQAQVCDYDVKPSAQFSDFNTLIIHRNGATAGTGTVTVTVYCKD